MASKVDGNEYTLARWVRQMSPSYATETADKFLYKIFASMHYGEVDFNHAINIIESSDPTSFQLVRSRFGAINDPGLATFSNSCQEKIKIALMMTSKKKVKVLQEIFPQLSSALESKAGTRIFKLSNKSELAAPSDSKVVETAPLVLDPIIENTFAAVAFEFTNISKSELITPEKRAQVIKSVEEKISAVDRTSRNFAYKYLSKILFDAGFPIESYLAISKITSEAHRKAAREHIEIKRSQLEVKQTEQYLKPDSLTLFCEENEVLPVSSEKVEQSIVTIWESFFNALNESATQDSQLEEVFLD